MAQSIPGIKTRSRTDTLRGHPAHCGQCPACLKMAVPSCMWGSAICLPKAGHLYPCTLVSLVQVACPLQAPLHLAFSGSLPSHNSVWRPQVTWCVTFLPERKLSPPQRISIPQAVGPSASGGQLHRAWEMKPCALISVLLATSFSSCGANC